MNRKRINSVKIKTTVRDKHLKKLAAISCFQLKRHKK